MFQQLPVRKFLPVSLVALLLVGAGLLLRQNSSSTLVQPNLTTPKPTGTRIVAVGDLVCSPDQARAAQNCQDLATYTLARQLNPDAVLLLGDIQYESGTLEAFRAAFAKTWGQFGGKLYPAAGNHEYGVSHASGYFDYFNGEGATTGRAGERGKGYYSFRLGGWKLLALNSNCAEIGGCDVGSAQYAWLQSELAASAQPCTLAFWHHPTFSSGKYADHGRGDSFWQQLVPAKADIILNGHDHLYERFAPMDVTGHQLPAGPRQFTAGTGGRSLYKQTKRWPASEKIIDNSYGVLVLDLTESSYTWRFIATDGAELDSGSAVCQE